MNSMKINHCLFPEGLLYDTENFVWVEVGKGRTVTLGITTILAYIAGRISTLKLKPVNTEVRKGKSVGTLESIRYFGVVRTPVSGRIVEVNHSIFDRPKLVNDFPYKQGWLARIEASNIDTDLNDLDPIEKCQDKISTQIQELRVRCFTAFPDHEMYEIGVECAATLAKLDESLTKVPTGEVIHLVSDDPTADIEMIRWSEQTGQSLLEMRTEGNLYHFIVMKVKDS